MISQESSRGVEWGQKTVCLQDLDEQPVDITEVLVQAPADCCWCPKQLFCDVHRVLALRSLDPLAHSLLPLSFPGLLLLWYHLSTALPECLCRSSNNSSVRVTLEFTRALTHSCGCDVVTYSMFKAQHADIRATSV